MSATPIFPSPAGWTVAPETPYPGANASARRRDGLVQAFYTEFAVTAPGASLLYLHVESASFCEFYSSGSSFLVEWSVRNEWLPHSPAAYLWSGCGSATVTWTSATGFVAAITLGEGQPGPRGQVGRCAEASPPPKPQPAPPSPARPLRYVALGDSIAKGWGLAGAIPKSKNDSCGNLILPIAGAPDMSRWDAPAGAYPSLLATMVEATTSRRVDFTNRACSGETTDQLLVRDRSRIADAIGKRPDIITIDIGGNDVLGPCGSQRLFGQAVTLAAQPWDAYRALRSQWLGMCAPATLARGLHVAEGKLPYLLRGLVAKTQAEIFIGTYYNATGTPAEEAVTNHLNAIIRDAARQAGPRVHVVELQEPFRYHDCGVGRSSSWLLGWDMCLHPNAEGQRQIARRFFAAMAPYLP